MNTKEKLVNNNASPPGSLRKKNVSQMKCELRRGTNTKSQEKDAINYDFQYSSMTQKPSEVIPSQQLIGQLKAAEARCRIQATRKSYYSNKANEIERLIGCQATAVRAVRLQSFMQSVDTTERKLYLRDSLNQRERSRLERLLADTDGSLVDRKIC